VYRCPRIAGVLAITTVGLLVTAEAIWAQVGEFEFQVNSHTPGDQGRPAVASTQDGGFVVTWTSYLSSPGTDNDESSVQWRRFGSDGLPLAGDFQVNSYTTGYQIEPSIILSSADEALSVWSGQPGDIQGRRFGSSGVPIADDFQINALTTSYQGSPAVACQPGGDFVVVWNSFFSGGTDSDGYGIQMRRVDPASGPFGSDFQVNTYTTNWQTDAAVATAQDGSFVVAWESGLTAVPDGDTIRARRFNGAGVSLGDDFLVSTNAAPRQADPDLGIAPDGSTLVVWEAGDNIDRDIRARFYSSTGLPQGGDFVVNSYTSNSQVNAAVALDPSGGFVVVWQSHGSLGGDTNTVSIQARRLTDNGVPLGEDFQVNLTEDYSQDYPDVAARSDGSFIVVWQSDVSPGTDSSDDSVLGRVVHYTFPIFGDGFESGSTDAWTGVVGGS